MPLQFIVSQKGNKLLLHNGYLHTFYKEGVNKFIWRCSEYKTYKCTSCYTTTREEIGDIIKESVHYSHAPDIAKVKIKEIITNIKEEAKTSVLTPRNLVSRAVEILPTSIIGQLPNIEKMSKTIRRERIKQQKPPANPVNVGELIISGEYSVTNKGEMFLFYDNKIQKRILIFSTLENLNTLKECSSWFGDGTFRSVPTFFSQLYTIHGTKNKQSFPLVYILMVDRSKDSYIEVLKALKSAVSSLTPQRIMVDFEMAFISAYKDEFPTTEIKGCFFHFQQCLWRKIQSCGLQQTYGDDVEFAMQIRSLSALAFIPTINVIRTFEELLDSTYFLENDELLSPIINYFEDTWIGRPNRNNRRRSPQFDFCMWNCYDSVLKHQPRTNNAVEGWHHAFNRALAANHVTIWKFINFLKQEQSLQEVKMEQSLSGEPSPKKRKKYNDYDERLFKIVIQYNEMTPMNYLRGIAHNLKF
ncbi:unnamed protein product [Macrosiphum euphorbiae]|uniref:MULE transposase domain-containing protein n=1 Tax=Macrosiphum euphorbiae TaxID=13131 RepID=A0AAV0WMU6_9HEMI|nr:unnamed protein product [Macrosiphum euphorbiae]